MKNVGGRPSIFPGKVRDSEHRVQGLLTDHGLEEFNARRRELAAVVNWPVEAISDGDVVEWLARRWPDRTNHALEIVLGAARRT